jgi:probable rRNA maturation factor
MLEIDIIMKVDSRYPFDRKRVRQALNDLLVEQGVDGRVELCLSVVGERKMRELEKKYFGRDEVTDVLSFSQEEGEGSSSVDGVRRLGDVVVCYPQAVRQARQWNKLIDDEIEFLSCHGLLHLLGIHHD